MYLQPLRVVFNSLYHCACVVLLLATLPSCSDYVTNNNASATDSVAAITATDSTTHVADSSDVATLYFTVADTGRDFYALRNKMYLLQGKLGWAIDTMNRIYDKKKDLIVVPDTDEDEAYRGEYFPRRFPSENMSLEYYQTYIAASTSKNIALVAGIYETRRGADSLLALLKPHASQAFLVKANVFKGCMH